VLLPIILAATAAGIAWRVFHVQSLERGLRSRLPVNEHGIARGAESIELPSGGDRAVLLIHGAGDTPQTLSYLAAHLHSRGYAILAPLLPGHGASLHDFARVTPRSLTDAVTDAYDRLASRYRHVAVVGLSMGGALAVRLAVRDRRVPAVVLLAPYLEMPKRLRRVAAASWIWGAITPFVRSRDPRSIRDPAEVALNRGYGFISAAALRSLVAISDAARGDLSRLQLPALVVQSRDDNRISAEACERAFAEITARHRKLVWVEGAGHVITVDYGRERVFAEVAEWLERWIPTREGGGAA
jgi:carboxylesterase